MSATLQIVTINDVYEIDNLPSFSTCLKECRGNGAHKTISTLPGDFVAPSLLSSLDKGASMIQCLNKCKLDYACIGNHESDVPLNQLHLRMRESTFTWINSNMENFPLPSDITLPKYEIVDVHGEDGHHRRVALIGLCCEDRSVMKPGAFNDCYIEPVLQAGARWYKHLMEVEKVDAVIPLTHQLIAFDRQMAQSQVGYPIIIGGHDHQAFNEEYGNCKVLKVGMDAERIGIINITWPDKNSVRPVVSITERMNSEFPKDEEVVPVVQRSKQVLVEIEKSRLCSIPNDMLLSSVGTRLCPTTMGTFLCTTLKRALSCDICMVGGGSIRASKNYLGRSSFTYADLKAEMPFNTMIAVLDLPGKVCAEMIQYTRSYALQNPPVAKGGYIQTDDLVVWDRDANAVIEINGAPLQPDKIYRACINQGMLDGLDDVVPLMQWKRSCPHTDTNAHKHPEASVEAKECIVSYFSMSMIFGILHSSISNLQTVFSSAQGKITKSELLTFLKNNPQLEEQDGRSPETTNMLVNNLFATMDLNADGEVTFHEVDILCNFYIQNIIFAKVHEKDVISIEEAVTALDAWIAEDHTMDKEWSEHAKDKLKREALRMDLNNDGFISRMEYDTYLQGRGSVLTQQAHKINI